MDRFGSLSANIDPAFLCVHPPENWLGLPFSKIKAPGKMRIIGLMKEGHIAKIAGKEIVRQSDTVVVARGGEKGGRLWTV